MSLWSQLWLLLGKNITLRKRQPVTLFVEFIWPIVLLLIVAFTKRASPPVPKGPCFYQPLELPNGDFLSFMKSFVCMLDYKCYDKSRANINPNKYQLAPLYDIITSGDNSYSKAAILLESLKNTLNDVNDIRNEKLVLKIQNGLITLNDFLNSTSDLKSILKQNGLNENIADAFLNSKIKIIEVYKKLNMSNKLKEPNLCQPLEAYPYLRASDYFYFKNNRNNSLKSIAFQTDFSDLLNEDSYLKNFLQNKMTRVLMSQLNVDEQANYNLAKVLCNITKLQMVRDSDFLFKEINVSSVTVYTNKITNYFTSPEFNKTIYYLSRYFVAGQKFGTDLALIQKFADFNEITNVMQNGLKLLSFIEKYNPQILFAKEMIKEFSPVFSNLKEFDEIDTLVDFVISVNKLFKILDESFTISSFYGDSLTYIFQKILDSDSYIPKKELLNSHIDFKQTLQFLIKLKFGNKHDAFCMSPKLNGLFSSELPSYVSTNLGYQLEKYCQQPESKFYFDQLAEQIFLQLDYAEIVRTIKLGIPPKISDEFMLLADKISKYNFNILYAGSSESLSKGFYSMSAALQYLEDSLSDITKLNLKNVYNLSKSLVKVFLPTLFSQEQWTYLDIFLPMVLPVLDMQNNFETVKPTFAPYPIARSFLIDQAFQSINDSSKETDLAKLKPNVSIISDIKKRSVYTTTSFPIPFTSAGSRTTNVFEEYYDFTTTDPIIFSTLNNSNNGRTFYDKNNSDLNDLFNLNSGKTFSGFNLANIMKPKSSIDTNISLGSSSSMNPMSIINIISMLNGNGGLSSATNIISTITPLLTLIPLDQYFPGISQQTSSNLLNSLPQLLKLIETFSNFHLPLSENGDNSEQIKQWKSFIKDLKLQVTTLASIMSNVGLVKPGDIQMIQKIINTNLETIGNPDVIGKIVLGCEGLNLWGVIQSDQKELKNMMNSVSLLIDIADLMLNASSKLVVDDGSTFECSNNPISDYYNLTKNLNVASTAAKLRQLIQNKQTSNLSLIQSLNCLKIDSIYSQFSKIQVALKNDLTGIIKKKLNCFRTSIFMPYNGIIDNLRTMFDSAATNADTITILSSQMNKFVDLVKLLSWINSLADQSNSGISLLDDPKQLSNLLNILPTLLKDVNEMSLSLKGMEYVQAYIMNMNDISNLQNGKNMFKLLESLKVYENEIVHASQAIDVFLKKYQDLINTSSYSGTMVDIQKGIQSLASLVNFFSQNVNGVKLNSLFSNFGKISRYLQNTYHISALEAEQIGESRLYQNPQQVYDSYMDAKTIYCDPIKLKKYFLSDSKTYIEVNDSGIKNFWQSTSNFLCKADFETISSVLEKLSSQFVLPPVISELFTSDSKTILNLKKNGSLFSSLNTSDFTIFNSNSMTKLNDMFKLFNGINPNLNANDLPNLFGRTLCGPDFSLRLEDYGYTIKPITINLDENNQTNITTTTKKTKMTRKLSTEEVCLNLYNQMKTIGGPVIGNLITPLLFGKILYTPNNTVVYKLIQKFNQTFQQFDRLNQLLTSFSNGVNQLDDLKRLTANLSLMLDNPLYQDAIQLFLLQDTSFTVDSIKNYLSILQNITSMSNDWRYIGRVVETVRSSFACFDTNRFVAVDNEFELEKLATKLFENATFLVGFVFENTKPSDVEMPSNFAVKLRMNVNNVPETNLIRPWLWIPGPSDNLFMDLRYMRGFIQIQNLLERAIISTLNEKRRGTMSSEAYNEKEFPVVYLKQFPYPKYTSEDLSASYVNYFILPIVVTLMWSGNIGLAIRNLIKEKEKFIEETMKAMGLRPGVNWLAWFLSTYIAMLIVSVIVSCVLKYGLIFPLTNLGLIFLSLSAFAFSAIMLSFFVASFFSKTNLASLIGILAYFVSYLPFILVMSLKYELNFGSKFAMCLSTATAFGYSSLYISWYEQQGKGLQWSQIWESPIPNDTMNYGVTILIMFLDGIIYGMLGWYVKKVFPGHYGASQPFYFILTPKFWAGTIFCRPFCRNSQAANEYYDDVTYREKRKKKSKDRYIETEPDHLPVGISIKDMSRKFKERTVVNNLSLNFFEGQITALLGHNGAGKSTTINVLTGIYAPTNGTAYIYNRDVRYEYNQIRKNVGICPQHDILFDYMTVKEHLVFYGKLKENMGRKELKRDINDMMAKIGLTQYSNENVSSLSGGLRRRLEVAIAFVSGSKTVILDEPTSGVDPYNRMKIWDIILEFRAGRTILLTTHYLEEADVLSDRIAIIHQGKLQCCGSSLFLKNRFGSGYILTIDIKQLSNSPISNNQTKQLLIEARSKSIEAITNFIAKRINGATLTRQINNNYNFTLPYSQKSNFEDFFIALEKNKNSLEISSYGISDTTLEEIFLLLTTRDENGDLLTPLSGKVVADTVSTLPLVQNLSTSFESDRDSGVAIELSSCDSNKSSPTPRYCSPQILSPSAALNTSIDSMSQAPSPSYSMLTRYTKLKGKKLYMQQFGALIMKRFHHYRRNLRILFTNIFLPCIFVALSMAFTTIRPKLTDQISLELTPEIYKPNDIFMTFDQTKNSYLKSINSEYHRAFNSVCASYQPNQYNEDIAPVTGPSLSKQALSSYLCDLISTDKCSLIYQFVYNSIPKQSSIFDSLKLFPTGPNCSVEPYLIETHMENLNKRIGGISYGDNLVKDQMYINQSKILVWFDNKAMHSAPSFLHEFYATYTKCTQSSNGQNCDIVSNEPPSTEQKFIKPLYKIYNHPISLSDERISYDSIVQKIADIGISLTILCAYAFIPAGFVVYIVRERITQEKRLQYVCGINPFLYWFSSFIWDFVYYMVIIGITIGVISSFGVTAYTANAKNFGSLILLLILFAWSSLPMSYVLSRFFKDVGSAYMMVFCFTLFSGIASCVAVFLLSFISESSPSIKLTYRFLEKFCLIFPSYSLGSGLIEITKNQLFADAYAVFGVNDVYKNPFSLDMLGQKYLSLIITGVVFFIIVALMETKITLFPCCKPKLSSDNDSKIEDIDVNQERKRIQNDEANSDILVVKNLTKKYRKATGSRVCAVNNVCFSIPWGHCFGLLGINGAGKTTTFKMITDEIKPTFGSRLFNDMTMKEFLEDNIIGYCPQFDAVDELLTGKEALYIYSKLIGLTDINTAIITAITRFKLQSFIDVPIIKYSGGMKRTLSVAVAMLGNPQIVLLDEPTNGMDPEMRRRVWDNILKLIKEERSVLLTSHSMAECDALCSRLAIMVSGQFMCLGTTQHLKHRFGGGYTLQIKVSKDSAINLVIEFIEAKFVNCILKDKHGNKLEYIIPHKGNSLGKIFGVMESNKCGYSIADYSVSQTTLDQVFINFAKSKRERDSDDEYEDDEIDESDCEVESELGDNKLNDENNQQIKVNLPPLDKNKNSLSNDNNAFDSIKNHFNSLKKSKHIRKTSSAKSQHRRQSTRSRRSQKSTLRNSISNGDTGFTNLAYEIEFKNSDACEFPQDSFNEDGDYFSKC